MNTAKIIPIDHYRAERHNPPRKIQPLPSADRLWELLDRNINISVWRGHNWAG